MKAWELLLSESQERMLLVVQKGKEQLVLDVFEKWDLPCSHIGEVTGDGLLQFYMHGALEAALPAHELVLGGGAPQYDREVREPEYLKKIKAFNADALPDCEDLKAAAEQLIALPNIASKRWVYEQYDSMVGAGTVTTNGPSDAAIVLAKPTNKALALTTDCNSRYVFADPYTGAMIAVAEAARNIVCSGGTPLGVTNCLNFGNPYDPEVYWQFTNAIKGMGEACIKFDTPVTGGNVSFYNQGPEGAVYPTPTIGMVGLLDSAEDAMTMNFKNVGDHIVLLGKLVNDIGGSEYLHKIKGEKFSSCPYFNLDEEFKMQAILATIIQKKIVNAAHDVSEGGLIITLLESAFTNEFGFEVNDNNSLLRADAFWFGEAQGRVVLSISPNQLQNFEAEVSDKIPYLILGSVAQNDITVNGNHWRDISSWKHRYNNAITSIIESNNTTQAANDMA